MRFEYILLAVVVAAAVYFLTKGKNKNKKGLTVTKSFPKYQSDVEWAVDHIKNYPKYWSDLEKYISVIEYLNQYHVKYSRATAQQVGRSIQFLIPSIKHIGTYPHRGRRIATTIIHELGHAKGYGHDENLDRFIRQACKDMNLPYVPYSKI